MPLQQFKDPRVAFTTAMGLTIFLAGAAPAQPVRALDAAAIERFVHDYRTRVGVPGVAVAVTRGTAVVTAAGFGHDSRGRPVTARTPMPIASLSKSFTAFAVMQLVEQGKVQLDRPVRDYLPDFRLADARAARITVRQLLDHTSGMADTTFPEKSGPLPASLADGVALLRTAPLAHDPGSRPRYHNPNYWVAARIVEAVSGEPFDGYLRRHVFGPAGMTDTRTVGLLSQAPDVGDGHVRVCGYALALPEPPWFLDGASGIVSTAGDMARWLIVQNNGGKAADGTRIVSAAHLDEMHRGLGWRTHTVDDMALREHGGWMFTFTAHQLLLEQSGYGIAVLSNVGLGLAPVDSEDMARALARMAAGQTPAQPRRIGLVVDGVLIASTTLAVVLGLRSVRRAPAWAERRAERRPWRIVLALLWRLLPGAALLALPAILSVVFGGRDASWLQVCYVAPLLVIWLGAAALAGLAVIIARAGVLVRSRAALLP